MLTTFDLDEYVVAAFCAGASSFPTGPRVRTVRRVSRVPPVEYLGNAVFGHQRCVVTITGISLMSVPEFLTPSTTLTEVIVYLATAEDDAVARVLLVRIARLARKELGRCDAVSITYAGDDGLTTLEADPELVRAVDEAQYADDDGPCLRALRGGHPVEERVETSIIWPGFRAQSLSLGLRSVLAVPLFSALSQPVASLNLWSRSPVALEPLGAALVELFDSSARTNVVAPLALEPGERQLTGGLRRALELHAIINRAIGYLAARHQVRLDEAFELLRLEARSSGTDIARTAGQLLIS